MYYVFILCYLDYHYRIAVIASLHYGINFYIWYYALHLRRLDMRMKKLHGCKLLLELCCFFFFCQALKMDMRCLRELVLYY